MSGVRTQHKKYEAMLVKWKRCRDAAAGEDAVHAGGAAYLPRLKEQEVEDYNAYVHRAPWFNATWRTIEGLRGMILRLPPKVDVPEVAKVYIENDMDGAGTPLNSLMPEVIEEVLKIGRLGLFVDYPSVDSSLGITLADAAKMNLGPRMLSYQAEQIINWETASVRNKKTLTKVVLEEVQSEPKPGDEFAQQEVKQWRVLDLDPASQMYRVRIYRIGADGTDVLMQEFTPLMQGRPLDAIPFFFIGTDDASSEVDDPPLIDLVNMNMSHYRTGADHEHGCHFTALPTAWVAGYKKQGDSDKLYVGSQTAWVFSNPSAKAGFLEFSGAGLDSLADNLDRKEKHMAVLGARMLEEQKRGVETAEVAAIHRSGEHSMLAATAWSISFGFKRALQVFCNWAGGTQDVDFDLNRRFFPTPMTFQELAALVAAWQQGAVSYETLFENLQQGDVIRQDITAEEERQRIDDQMPLVPAAAAAKAAATAPAEGAPSPAKGGGTQKESGQTIHLHIPKGGGGKKTVTAPDGSKYTITEE